VSFVTLDAPPDPGQLNEQAFPLMQEYCHSNATSDAPRLGASGRLPSWALSDCTKAPLTSKMQPKTSD
jgi:hypothetical protein